MVSDYPVVNIFPFASVVLIAHSFLTVAQTLHGMGHPSSEISSGQRWPCWMTVL